MRIYYSKAASPVIADSVAGLNGLAALIGRFVDSSEPYLFLEADASGEPQPYDRLLHGISFMKDSGPVRVRLLEQPRLVLAVTGSRENLRTWSAFFAFPADAQVGDHHHPEYVDRQGYIDSRSLSVTLEVGDD